MKTVTITKIVRFDDDTMSAFFSLAKLVREMESTLKEARFVMEEIRGTLALETIDEEYEAPDTDETIYFNR